MKPGKRRPGWIGRSSTAATLVALLVPASASAIAGNSSDGGLSRRLAELAKPSMRSASPAQQARSLSLAAHGAGSLVREDGRVLVDVRFEHGAVAGLDDLRATDARIVDASRRYQTVTVAVRPADLGKLSLVPRVAGVTEVLAPLTAAGPCPSGSIVSEGDSQLRAAQARGEFGVDGAGVTVGILSDSFDRDTKAATNASQDVAGGDLPGSGSPCGNASPVNLVDDSESAGADEGRAMGQIVHDLAPGAKLAFATAFTSETGFAANIRKLAEPVGTGGAGATVIADDVFFFGEPFFQDGPIAVAANDVSAAGTAYFSAAGNDNVIDAQKRDIGSWEAPEFRDVPSCPPELGAAMHHCMDFNPASGSDNTFGITVAKGATFTVDLQWAEPWNGVESDLDLFLLDSNGNLIGSSTGDNVGSSQRPFEFLQWTNTSGSSKDMQLAINRCFGEACNPAASGTTFPRLKLILLDNGAKGVTSTEYAESVEEGDTVGPTIFGHSGAAGAVSVGAVRFSESDEPEYYSSHGPVTHYFGPVSGAAAAPPLSEAEELVKPDLVATDGGANTFFGAPFSGGFRFYGTSAAAPHAAAVAALMLDANPLLGPSELRAALVDSGRSVGPYWHDAVVGGGLVDAVGALGLVASHASSEGEGGSEGTGEGDEEEAGNGPAGEGEPTPQAAQATGTPAYSSASSFARDRNGPRTFLRHHPRHVIHTRHRRARAVFLFGSNEKGVTFTCRVDRSLFRHCRRRYARRFHVGRHVLRVTARDAAGNFDRTPAVYRFRVKRRRAD